jgi:hypothetical protein
MAQVREMTGWSKTGGLKAGVLGWRCSGDRAGRTPGNFTGNCAFGGGGGDSLREKTIVMQPLTAGFPNRINRENISENRDFFGNKEIWFLPEEPVTKKSKRKKPRSSDFR